MRIFLILLFSAILIPNISIAIEPVEVVNIIEKGNPEGIKFLENNGIISLSPHYNEYIKPTCEIKNINVDKDQGIESLVICLFITTQKHFPYDLGECESFFILVFKYVDKTWEYSGQINSVGFDTPYRRGIKINFPILIHNNSHEISMTYLNEWPKGMEKVFSIYHYDNKYSYKFKQIYQYSISFIDSSLFNVEDIIQFIEYSGIEFPKKIINKNNNNKYIWNNIESIYIEEK